MSVIANSAQGGLTRTYANAALTSFEVLTTRYKDATADFASSFTSFYGAATKATPRSPYNYYNPHGGAKTVAYVGVPTGRAITRTYHHNAA